jgi:ribosomal protein L37AE/L43A
MFFWSKLVSAKAGEIARESGTYRCEKCQQNITVQVGVPIGECKHCGNTSFATGWRSLSNQPSTDPIFDGVS